MRESFPPSSGSFTTCEACPPPITSGRSSASSLCWSASEGSKYRRPPRSLIEVAICDLNAAFSVSLNRNMKSAGKRARLRFTCSLKRFVVTPYSAARSASITTLWPRTTRICRAINGRAGFDRSCYFGSAGGCSVSSAIATFRHALTRSLTMRSSMFRSPSYSPKFRSS